MNTRRKKKLFERATKYSAAQHPSDELKVLFACQDGFEAGYRAAMRDMRKVLHEAIFGHDNQQMSWYARLVHAMREFLRPLR